MVTMKARARQTVKARLDRAAQACAQRGAQLTELRRHVLRLILEAKGPLSAYQLLDRLKQTRKGAVPATVYRALEFLMEHHLIHRVARLNAFIACADDVHEHPAQFLICSQCGTVTEIEDRGATKALEHAAQREGFHPGDAVIEIEGTCAACFHPA